MLEATLALLFGLLAGSFLNVCVFRVPNDYSIVGPRSYCPQCRLGIAWYDNIPLLSYVLLRGRCRHCRGRISPRYPVVEAITGALFFTIFYTHPDAPGVAIKLCVFAALIVGLIFMDLSERVLPDQFTMGGAALGIVLAPLVPFQSGLVALFLPDLSPRVVSLIEAAAGAAVSGLLLAAVGRLYKGIRGREGLGGGDPRMVAMVGAFLGLHGALATVLLGSLLGSVIGLAYITIARKKASTYELPFGSFLGVAALAVALLWTRPV